MQPKKMGVKSKQLLVVAAVVGSTALASVTNVGFFEKNCTSDSTRPCYEEQLKKINRIAEKNGGRKFAACVKDTSSEYGTIHVSTALCSDEVVQYCTKRTGSGKGNDKSGAKSIMTIRKFDGTCATMEPLPPPIPIPPPPPASEPAPIPDIIPSVTAPVGGRGWVRGSTMTIHTTYTGTYGGVMGSIGANLLKGGVKVRDIVVPAQGMPYVASLHTTWTIPLDTEPGADYAIEIFYADRPSMKAVSGNFSILGDTLRIYGKVINKFTGQPIPNMNLLSNNEVIPTAADGSYTLDRPTTVWGLYTQNKACYLQSTSYSGQYNFNDHSYWLYRYAFPEPHAFNDLKPVLGAELENNIPVWPGVNFSLKSDIPVSFNLEYGTTNNGPGNGSIRTEHYLSVSFPLDYDVRVHLKDQAGNVYTSPYHRLARDYGCAPVTLTFANGVFTWE